MRIENWSLYDQFRARELRSEPYLCIFRFSVLGPAGSAALAARGSSAM